MFLNKVLYVSTCINCFMWSCRMEAEQKRQAEIEKQRKQQEEMEREQEALRKKMIQQRLVCA